MLIKASTETFRIQIMVVASNDNMKSIFLEEKLRSTEITAFRTVREPRKLRYRQYLTYMSKQNE